MGLRHSLLLNRYCLVLFILINCPLNAFATWSGSEAIVQGSWGAGDNQFGITYEDTTDIVPTINLTTEQKIIVRDGTNRRVKVYNSTGTLESIVAYKANRSYKELTTADSYGFTGDFVGYGDGSVNFYYRADQKIYINFSPTGQLIKTYTTRPAELGTVSEKSINSTSSKITVQYPDKTWSYTDVGRMSSYMRDTNGNLYGYGNTQVIRYTTCGKEAAMLMMPKKIVQETSRGPQIDPQVTVLEEYGSPIIAPNGDVYTWKRTPTAYSILKWTWVDDPNASANTPDAPQSLTIKIISTGINLFWQAVPQDPGCVTGYELVRSTTAGGPYSTLAIVNAGTANAVGTIRHTDATAVAGTTYYYKVRAMAGTVYSAYTSEVSATR